MTNKLISGLGIAIVVLFAYLYLKNKGRLADAWSAMKRLPSQPITATEDFINAAFDTDVQSAVDRNLYRVPEEFTLFGKKFPTGLSANWIYQTFGTGFSEGESADEYQQILAQSGVGVERVGQ